MEDLSIINNRVGEFLRSEHATMVKTGDMLTGRMDCPIAQYMDTLYDLWGSYTVHGDKIAYSKIAIGLLDSLNRILPETDLRHNLQSRKRSLLTYYPGGRTASRDASVSARAAPHCPNAGPHFTLYRTYTKDAFLNRA
jgi:hypothetical protein